MQTQGSASSSASHPLRIFVVGGAGFIGSHLVELLLASCPARRVLTLDLLTRVASLNNLAQVRADPRHLFVRGDGADAALVRELIASFAPDAIVNLAAQSHVDCSIVDPRTTVHSNIMTTVTLLEEGRRAKVPRFLQVSTEEVYGPWGEGQPWFTEESPLKPSSPYAASKAGADLLVLAAWRTHGYPVLLTRGCNTYGPRQFPEKLIPVATLELLAGRPMALYGDGLHERCWLHVSDHCRALVRVLEQGQPGLIYNIGSGTRLTNQELIWQLSRIIEFSGMPFVLATDRLGHDRGYRIDDTRLRLQLGWAPEQGFPEGLRQTADWYRSHPGWWCEPPALAVEPPSAVNPVRGIPSP